MMRLMGRALVILVVAIPQPAAAHAFGQSYQLPIPLWLFLFGAGATIVLSFLLIGLFVTEARHDHPPRERVWRPSGRAAAMASRAAVFGRTVTLTAFVFTLAVAYLGVPLPDENPAPTMFWIVFLLGLTYMAGLVGDVWPLINPIRPLAAAVERWLGTNPWLRMPASAKYVPALLLLFLVIGYELLTGQAAIYPPLLGFMLIGYVLVTILGSVAFGSDFWFRYGDPFSAMFRVLGRIAPFELRDHALVLRAPLSGADRTRSASLSLVGFIVLVLASTAYDGFGSTLAGYQTHQRVAEVIGTDAAGWTLFAATAGAFGLAYAGAHVLGRALRLERDPLVVLLRRFAYSLVPIALGYNLAHYFILFLIQGQFAIPLLGDPLARGWNLLGLADYRPRLGFLTGGIVWYAQVAFILAGHVAGIYLAHRAALRAHAGRGAALASQIPMVLLMAAFTMAGLWLLSQAGTAPE